MHGVAVSFSCAQPALLPKHPAAAATAAVAVQQPKQQPSNVQERSTVHRVCVTAFSLLLICHCDRRVHTLVTLGTPHTSAEPVTRRNIDYVNEHYKCMDEVRWVSVTAATAAAAAAAATAACIWTFALALGRTRHAFHKQLLAPARGLPLLVVL
jgi:hypothetical protein